MSTYVVMKFCYRIIDVIGQIVLIKLHEIPDFVETEYFFNLVLEVSKDLKNQIKSRKIVKSNQIKSVSKVSNRAIQSLLCLRQGEDWVEPSIWTSCWIVNTKLMLNSDIKKFGLSEEQMRRNYFSKVQLFWEGHKNLELSSTWFDTYLVNVKSSGR